MINTKNKAIITSVIGLSLMLSGCVRLPFMASMMPPMGIPVSAVSLKSTPIAQTGIYQAKLISRNSVWLQPQVAGQIAAIYVKAGDHVSAGQPLMLIDKRRQEATLNSSRASAASAKASIEQAKDMLSSYQVQKQALQSNLELNKKLYERYKALYAKKSVSQQDFEKYTDSYNKAKADMQQNAAQIQAQRSAILAARSNYEKAVSDISEQQVQLQYYKITAPYSGVIGDIPVKVGNYVTMPTQLLNITQNSTLEVNVGLPIDKVFEIQPGLPVEVLDNNGKVVGSAKISFVAPNIDTGTQTILTKANLQNPRGILKADQSVKVRVIYNRASGILVPTSSISHFGGQDFAFIINQKGKQFFVKQQPVKLGEMQGDKYVVLSGLKDGQQIVSQGIQKLTDNAPVMVMPEGNK